MGILSDLAEGGVEGFFSSIWKALFPPKTAADQRADDEAETAKDANDAIKIREKVDTSSIADVESDLDKHVRSSDS